MDDNSVPVAPISLEPNVGYEAKRPKNIERHLHQTSAITNSTEQKITGETYIPMMPFYQEAESEYARIQFESQLTAPFKTNQNLGHVELNDVHVETANGSTNVYTLDMDPSTFSDIDANIYSRIEPHVYTGDNNEASITKNKARAEAAHFQIKSRSCIIISIVINVLLGLAVIAAVVYFMTSNTKFTTLSTPLFQQDETMSTTLDMPVFTNNIYTSSETPSESSTTLVKETGSFTRTSTPTLPNTCGCSNGGTCDENENCVCTRDFYGELCLYEKFRCTETLCKNGGTCDDSDTRNQTFCYCPGNFVGQWCERTSFIPGGGFRTGPPR